MIYATHTERGINESTSSNEVTQNLLTTSTVGLFTVDDVDDTRLALLSKSYYYYALLQECIHTAIIFHIELFFFFFCR